MALDGHRYGPSVQKGKKNFGAGDADGCCRSKGLQHRIKIYERHQIRCNLEKDFQVVGGVWVDRMVVVPVAIATNT